MLYSKNDFLLDSHSLDQLLTKIKPPATIPKSYKTDPDRLLYSQLLEFSTRRLQTLQKDITNQQNSIQSPLSHLASQLFNPLFEEIIELSRRECAQKAYLLKMVYDFYHQAIVAIQKHSQEKTRSFIAEYSSKLGYKESQLLKEKKQLSLKMTQMMKENEQKWKTFYMIVRDNRVLRRQKGKLLRSLKQERTKVVKTHWEMVALARENEKHKLLANYQQQESLEVFLKNQLALKRMEQFMKDYPKRAKRVMLFNLKELQIMEQKALDCKIDYILKAARQSEEIFDQYEDLVDFVPINKILFNTASQTDPEEEEGEEEQQRPKITVSYAQTTEPTLKLVHKQISYCIGHRQPQNRRRRKEVIALNESLQIQQVARVFSKERLIIQKRVFSLRIYQKFTAIKNLVLCRKIINQNLLIECDEDLIPRSAPQKLSPFRSRQFNTKRQSGSSITSALNKNMGKETERGKQTELKTHKDKYRNSIETSGNLDIHQIAKSQSNKLIVNINRSSTTKLRYSKQNVQTEPNYKVQATEIKEQGLDEIQSDKDENCILRDSSITSMNQLKASKNTILINDKKENNLVVRKTGPKKRTMLRMSGFAAQNYSKKSVTQQQESRMTLKSSLEGVESRNSVAGLYLSNNQEAKYFRKSTNNLMIGGSERLNRETVNQKHINLLGQQSCKLIQKLMKAIYVKRNEIAQGKMTFEYFLSEYMTNHYSPQIKVFFISRITSRSDYGNPLVKALDLLLSNYHTQPYLKYIFGLFGKLIVMHNSSSIFIEDDKGYTIKKQLLKNTLGQDLSKFQRGDQNCGNICNIFIDLQQIVSPKLTYCELYSFLRDILPQSQKFMLFQEVKEILSVFVGQSEHMEYLKLLSHYCKNEMSPLILCALAFRQKWNRLIHFKNTIENKYNQWFGEFSLENVTQVVQRLQHSERLSWTYRLLSNKLNKEQKKPSVFTLKYVCVLFIANDVEKQLPLSSLLSDLSNLYCIVTLKKNQQGAPQYLKQFNIHVVFQTSQSTWSLFHHLNAAETVLITSFRCFFYFQTLCANS